MRLEDKYPLAFSQVMAGNLRFCFSSLSIETQEQTLIDITKNMEVMNNGK